MGQRLVDLHEHRTKSEQGRRQQGHNSNRDSFDGELTHEGEPRVGDGRLAGETGYMAGAAKTVGMAGRLFAASITGGRPAEWNVAYTIPRRLPRFTIVLSGSSLL
jgi:hypothetical protein